MSKFSFPKSLAAYKAEYVGKVQEYYRQLGPQIEGKLEDHIATQDALASDPLLRAACRTVRMLTILQKPLTDAFDAARSKVGYGDYMEMCLTDKDAIRRRVFMLPGKTAETIKVFPEIWVSKENNTLPTYNAGFTVNPYSTHFINHWYTRAKSMPKAWQPLSRALTRMLKCTEVSVQVALARYTSLREIYTEAQVNRLAETIINHRRPAQLIFAHTPDEFLEMYWNVKGGPSSCMTNGGQVRDWAKLPENNKVHPCAWYAYTGNTYGAYMMKGTEAMARAIVYNEAKKDMPKKWVMGRLYASTSYAGEKFKEELKKTGVDVSRGSKELIIPHTDWDFEVPVVKSKDYGEVIPVPYVDNLYNGFKITLNSDKTAVRFVSEKSVGRAQIMTPVGYFATNALEGVVCETCGGLINPMRVFRTTNNHVFCGDRCLQAAGFVVAHNSDGGRAYIPAAEAYRVTHAGDDGGVHGLYFGTNEHAARVVLNARHALWHDPVLNAYIDKEDEDFYRSSTDTGIMGKNDSYIRTYPIDAETISVDRIRMFEGVHREHIPFKIKCIREVEIPADHKPISDELAKLLDAAGKEFFDPEEVHTPVPPSHVLHTQEEVAPGVSSEGKQKRRPTVRYIGA